MNDSGLLDLSIDSYNGDSTQGIVTDSGDSGNNSLPSTDNPPVFDSSVDTDSSNTSSDNTSDIPEDMVSSPETSSDTQPDNLTPTESADMESGTDYTTFLSNIESLLYQHNYDTGNVISVSGNTIMITPDDMTTALLTDISKSQQILIDGQTVLSGTVFLIFIAFMLNVVSHSVRRMVKYIMKGGKSSD